MIKGKSILLEEQTESTYEDVLTKIVRLDAYIKKSERRLKVHERTLAKLRKDMTNEIKTMKGLLKGKIYG